MCSNGLPFNAHFSEESAQEFEEPVRGALNGSDILKEDSVVFLEEEPTERDIFETLEGYIHDALPDIGITLPEDAIATPVKWGDVFKGIDVKIPGVLFMVTIVEWVTNEDLGVPAALVHIRARHE